VAVRSYTETFGVSIAFIAPGVVVIWGIAQHSDTVRQWFGSAAEAEVSVGGFLFVLLASLAMGVFVQGIRWALINPLVHLTGVEKKNLDHSEWRDAEKLAAFTRTVEDFYRYYQFYSNMIVATLIAYALWLNSGGVWPWERPLTLVLGLPVLVVLFLSARNSMDNYLKAGERILGTLDD
jgi:hypothetical protein